MERIQSTRFSFRRKGSKNKDKEARDRDATIDFDYDMLSYLRLVTKLHNIYWVRLRHGRSITTKSQYVVDVYFSKILIS